MREYTFHILVAADPTIVRNVRYKLHAADIDVGIHGVHNRAELDTTIDTCNWQLVLGERRCLDFDVEKLLEYLVEKDINAPFLLCSDTDVEALRLRCLEEGIAYFVLANTDHLDRLPVLVRSLLSQAEGEMGQQSLDAELLEIRERYQDIFDNTSDLIQCLAPDGTFLYTNKAWRETMGYTETEVATLNLMDVLHSDSLVCCQDRFERLKEGECLSSIDFKFVTKQGKTVHLAGDCGSIIKDGEAISTRGIFKNITETVETCEALKASEARYQALYENAPDIYTRINQQGLIASINRTGARMLGYTVGELIDEPALNLVHPEDQRRVQEYFEKQFENFTEDAGIEYRKIRKDSSVLWVHQRVSMEAHSSEPGLLVVCRDVTEKRLLEDQLAYQATHDPLTNLINRREFEHRLQRLLRSNSGEHVLCYLDLDQFKVINDTCGHIAGDELLRQIASLLGRQIRSRDTLARLGGDEFAVLMEHCSLRQAERLAERMREVIDDFRFQWQHRRFAIGVSIGVVPVAGEGLSLNEVLSHADSACYAAKDQGRNRIHVSHPEDTTVSGQVGQMHWAASITEALEQDHFLLYAQPIRPCTMHSHGERLEILLRMQDGGQAVRPGAFMSAAERYNLSPKIDRWVLSRLIQWFEEHPEDLRQIKLCSVNLSALSLCDDSFHLYAVETLRNSSFPAHKLCFEVTETAAISNLSKAMEFFAALKEIGCSFALDDFGSGLSSFAYLKNLPVDMIKIDGAFIRNIEKNEVDRAMVRSICEIVSMMGKQTTAEYVESQKAWGILHELGVDFAQGYHLGRPRPLEQYSGGQVIPFLHQSNA